MPPVHPQGTASAVGETSLAKRQVLAIGVRRRLEAAERSGAVAARTRDAVIPASSVRQEGCSLSLLPLCRQRRCGYPAIGREKGAVTPHYTVQGREVCAPPPRTEVRGVSGVGVFS
jgi:hypothetical protein